MAMNMKTVLGIRRTMYAIVPCCFLRLLVAESRCYNGRFGDLEIDDLEIED
jgi:hypothetical protein